VFAKNNILASDAYGPAYFLYASAYASMRDWNSMVARAGLLNWDTGFVQFYPSRIHEQELL
jgi:succinate dehydrogenase/fumarate reductase flavoprotein subunit